MADSASKRKQGPDGPDGSALKKRKVMMMNTLYYTSKGKLLPRAYGSADADIGIINIGGRGWEMEDAGSKGKARVLGGNGQDA